MAVTNVLHTLQRSTNHNDNAEHYISRQNINHFYSIYVDNALIQQKQVSTNTGIAIIDKSSLCHFCNIDYHSIPDTEVDIFIAWNPLFTSDMKKRMLAFCERYHDTTLSC